LHSFTPTKKCKPAKLTNTRLTIVLINIFSTRSNLMATASRDQALADIHESGIAAIACPPDGQCLACGEFDKLRMGNCDATPV